MSRTGESVSALDAIYGRRTARSFTSKKVSKSAVRALIDAAVQAPTAMDQQPWVFVVVQDPRVLLRLEDRVKAAWVEEASPPRRLHLDHVSHAHDDFVKWVADPKVSVFHGAQTLVVIAARRTDPFVVADCWLAAQNLMLAARALGLGTCCCGSAVSALNTAEARAILGVPADVTAVAPIVVGEPSGLAGSRRRRKPDIVRWT